jgi:hypothetical protein
MPTSNLTPGPAPGASPLLPAAAGGGGTGAPAPSGGGGAIGPSIVCTRMSRSLASVPPP